MSPSRNGNTRPRSSPVIVTNCMDIALHPGASLGSRTARLPVGKAGGSYSVCLILPLAVKKLRFTSRQHRQDEPVRHGALRETIDAVCRGAPCGAIWTNAALGKNIKRVLTVITRPKLTNQRR